ncbi:MAG TPA: hypothetical protein VFH61_10630, partial [Thermoleophilia bacterium]|nr:hypothetical protein [Thermoleophilia bacterium]
MNEDKDKRIAELEAEVRADTAEYTTLEMQFAELETGCESLALEKRALEAEVARLRRFVKDSGTTLYACEACGHGRTTKECIHCDLTRHRAIVARLEDDCMAEAIALMGKGIGF